MRAQIDAELPTFADLLLRYDCDVELTNKAVDTSAKDKLKETTADEFEEFAKALVEKDDSYFLLSEIYFPSFDEKLFNKDAILSAEGLEMANAIKDGYIPAKNMNRICKYHFSGQNYKHILSRLKLKGVERVAQKISGTTTSVYKVR